MVYGPEGIGKSTFAAQFPEVLFIDTEGSTKDMDVGRFEAPSSWTMLLEEVSCVRAHPELCRTLVIDTADWAEMLCISHVCSKYQKQGIEDFGYGKGYVYVQEEFGRLLNGLEEVVKNGTNVVLTAHAKMRKFEQPDEMGAYDRWEMKLTKQTSPMVKEWADMILFANYKTYVVNVDGQGAQKGKNKAQGGKRVMYTSHHPCWDAKNRYGLDNELPFAYSEIAHIIEAGRTPAAEPQEPAEEPGREEARQDSRKEDSALPPFMQQETMEAGPSGQPVPPEEPEKRTEPERPAEGLPRSLPENIPKALRDLMEMNHVDEWHIQNAVAAKGYYPEDTPIQNYDPDFINGVLIGAWDQVYAMVEQMKRDEKIPF